MPFNFLELVPSYQKAGVRKKARQRCTIVAKHLTDAYCFRKNDPEKQKAIEEAHDSGIATANEITVSSDARRLQTAFEYLGAGEEKKQSVRNKIAEMPRIPYRMFGIVCLTKDSVESWSQILALKKECEQAAGNQEIIIPPIVIAEDASDDVGARPVEPGLFEIAQSAAEFLPTAAQTFASIIPRILDEIKDRDKRITLLSGQCESLNQQAGRLLVDIQQAHQRARQWEEYAIETDEQRKADQAKTLLELAEVVATKSERGMEVLKSVNRYLEDHARRQHEQAQMEIINGFPEKVIAGNMAGHRFVYEESFLNDLRKRTKEDQQKVRYALLKFSENGETYPSLQTHAITDDWMDCLPEGCSSSRASDELRFYWKAEGNKVHLYLFGKKGEKRLQNSEA